MRRRAPAGFRLCANGLGRPRHRSPPPPRLPSPPLCSNHEAECHSPACLLDEHRKESLHNFSAYTHRFRMPSAESLPSPGTLNQWYR